MGLISSEQAHAIMQKLKDTEYDRMLFDGVYYQYETIDRLIYGLVYAPSAEKSDTSDHDLDISSTDKVRYKKPPAWFINFCETEKKKEQESQEDEAEPDWATEAFKAGEAEYKKAASSAWFIHEAETKKPSQEHPQDWFARMDKRIEALEIKQDDETNHVETICFRRKSELEKRIKVIEDFLDAACKQPSRSFDDMAKWDGFK